MTYHIISTRLNCPIINTTNHIIYRYDLSYHTGTTCHIIPITNRTYHIILIRLFISCYQYDLSYHVDTTNHIIPTWLDIYQCDQSNHTDTTNHTISCWYDIIAYWYNQSYGTDKTYHIILSYPCPFADDFSHECYPACSFTSPSLLQSKSPIALYLTKRSLEQAYLGVRMVYFVDSCPGCKTLIE